MGPPVKGPRFVDVGSPDVETREYVVVGSRAEFGRTTVTIRCPFCNANVLAYLWSLAGGGKRCTCGALLSHYGDAHHYRTAKTGA